MNTYCNWSIKVLTITWQEAWPAIAGLGVLVAAFIAVLVACARTARRVTRMEKRYARLMSGSNGSDLEQILDAHLCRVEDATEQVEAMRAQVGALQQSTKAAVQHLGIVRFNPFASTGGDLSFALAALDADGNGVVVCSLHGRGDTRIYAKPVAAWQSAYALSDEEVEAIRRARDGAPDNGELASPPAP